VRVRPGLGSDGVHGGDGDPAVLQEVGDRVDHAEAFPVPVAAVLRGERDDGLGTFAVQQQGHLAAERRTVPAVLLASHQSGEIIDRAVSRGSLVDRVPKASSGAIDGLRRM
jgi:hypothetical protein